jgi:hypothetical protein
MVLLATVAAAWFAPPKDDEAVSLTEHVRNRSPGASRPLPPAQRQPSPVAPTSSTSRSTGHLRTRDLDNFEDLTLLVPTPIAPTAAPPVAAVTTVLTPAPPMAPQAPPLPFRYMGRYHDAVTGEAAVFLQYAEQSLVVRLGDTILNQYKLESLDGASLTVRYLPLDQVQTLTTVPLN